MAEQQRISAIAFSSNSSVVTTKKYDVFLSYRREDTYRNFTSHLYEALMQKKVETYIDHRHEKGDEISPALIKAIEDSHVSVVIFSENYASSKWCLGELSKILECQKIQGQIVIPMFYDIDSSDVRKQTGSYEQAFAKHEGDPRCNKWKAALTEAANLAGWSSQTYRTEPEFIKDIVEDILQKLAHRYKWKASLTEAANLARWDSPTYRNELDFINNIVEDISQKLAPRYVNKHDVFLSFRAEDTHWNFTCHLYNALNDKKVKTFMDEQLDKGDEISLALIKAIEDSRVSVIIFSENYDSSKWCLGELDKILQCQKVQGQIVIPVFYGIDPSHVRKQAGSYRKAFAKHKGDLRCNKWKAALAEAANLAGWDSRTYRTQPQFLKDIVEDILQKLAPRYSNQHRGLVGIEESYQQIESLLKIGSSAVKTIGIWGMSGIGKTTLATALYDKLSYAFEGHCFLANVREKSGRLEALHDELLSKLLGNKNNGFDNFDMNRLRRKKVFIVLDDVDTSEQLGKLIVEFDFLGPGSRVIVTTRNKQILSPIDEIYQVKELSFDHSLQLFCLTVFGEEKPKDGYEDLSRRAISYCKGTPLAIEILGASLRSRSKENWGCELRKLEGETEWSKWKASLTKETNLAEWDSPTYRIESEFINNVVEDVSQTLAPRYHKKYDVFLSFLGEDTHWNFTSHLYKALNDEKVKTYIDDQVEKGDEISPALIKTIKDSHVSIVVFSENYASSKWCLDELSNIMECHKILGQIVMPVFYGIDPLHVNKQTGSYGQALAKHEADPKCNKWKFALTEARNLAGWVSQTYRTDFELLKDIVGDVLQKLPPRYRNQHKGLIGIEEQCKQIESLLKFGSSKIITLGIWGMGGIGKTTLATALYDRLSYEFEGRCFLTNVREKSGKLEALRDQLFSKLLEKENHGFDHFGMSRLRRKKVFIVLDDVATSDQFEKLIVEYDFLGAGSRVIVTTRNRQILDPVDEIYQMQELSSHDSLQLFCLTVFGKKQAKDGYEHLSRRAISYCKGIPLALKVLGANLRRRCKQAWEWEFKRLHEIPNMEIHKVLKLSHDGLYRFEKDIFLDIACFFRGQEEGHVTSLLEAFGFFVATGVEVLLDKALITISDGYVEMHDFIQEMGREIVHQECIKDPGRRSRLWKPEEVQDVLKYNKGTDVVEGIILDLSKLTGDLYLSSDSLAKMPNVRFLKIHNAYRSNRYNVYLPDGLESLPYKWRYLLWDGFCLEYFLSNFCAKQLVELRMPGNRLKKLWDGVQNLENLKAVDFSRSRHLIEIPDLSKAEKLENVYLSFCESLRQLHVPSKSLRILHLISCSSLKEISLTSEEMTELNLADTPICALPSSIWHNRKLAFLYLSGCNNLNFAGNKLSDDPGMGHLWSLEVLDLRGTNVESLPANITNLSKLRRLALDNCRNLVSLPELPPSLEQLMALNCTSLETDFTQWQVLQHMFQNRIPYLHKHHLNPRYYDGEYFFIPGDHVINECGFRTAESSITISCLPQSGLCGFIYCVILSKGSYKGYVSCSISQDGIRIGGDGKSIHCTNLMSDHVLFFLYCDASKFHRTSEVYDHFSHIPFKFEFAYCDNKYVVEQERIKGCAVFPVCFSASGLKLASSSGKDVFEVRVGGSNNENEDDWKLPRRLSTSSP